MGKYLYGASVQGIQAFIFASSKLKEIIGASEIVEMICTDLFKNVAAEYGKYDDENLLLGAAGNIKYIFNSREECEAAFKHFPRRVMTQAPGITLSQGAVELDIELKDANDKLEEILRVQRNIGSKRHDLGWMISERSRRTGNPSIGLDRTSKEFIDQAQKKKREASKSGGNTLLRKMFSEDRLPQINATEMQEVLHDRQEGWLAVIHADGNALGQKLIKLKEEISLENYQSAFKEVSENLKEATEAAAGEAYRRLEQNTKLNKLIARPVILGGDDLTIIIDGKFALDFTHHFLELFEKESQKAFANFERKYDGFNLFSNGLTACAGIAYVKPNFPFHYAATLSETLCKHAKKVSKEVDSNIAPSSLMFHKVHSSFVEDFKTIKEQELTAGNTDLNFGPYFLKPSSRLKSNAQTIAQLKKWVECIQEEGSPASPIRNWLTDLAFNEERARQKMKRITSLNKGGYADKLGLKLDMIGKGKATHLHDVLSIASIQK